MGVLFTALFNRIAMFKDSYFIGKLYTYAIATEPLLAILGMQNADWTNHDDRINGISKIPAPSG